MVDNTTLIAFSQMLCVVHAEEEVGHLLLLAPVLAQTQRMDPQTQQEMDALGMKKALAIDADNTTPKTFSLILCVVDVEEEVVDQLFPLIYVLAMIQHMEQQIQLEMDVLGMKQIHVTDVVDNTTRLAFSQISCVVHAGEEVENRPLI